MPLQKKSGYSVLELIFYMAIFAVLSVALINSLLTMTRSFRETSTYGELVQSGSIMERIAREVRSATSINTISGSDLKLNTLDSAGSAKTVEFLLAGSNIELLENNALTGNLNSTTISITALSFTRITTAEGEAVKILLTLRSNNDPAAHVYDFYDTVVLRGAY
jgi:type II secretory pathway pseudopilin PulG